MPRILIIDDEKNVRQMMRMTLIRAGYMVEAAGDGPTGIAAFGDGSGWDLVLVDQRMPGMSGAEVMGRLQQLSPCTPAIMVTAYPTATLAAEVVGAGAVDFLRKPFSAEMLRGAVAAALERSPDATARQSDPAQGTVSAPSPPLGVMAPRVYRYLNGFTYWPDPPQPGEVSLPAGVVVFRRFQVRAPSGMIKRCVVGVEPHVRLQLRDLERHVEAPDALWDIVCDMALTDLLWTQAQLPPNFLPVYDLTNDQLEQIRTATGSMPTLTY